MTNKKTVALSRAENYDFDLIKGILAEHFRALNVDKEFFAGKKVAIKPNLVMKKSPDAAATTHPVVLDALLSLLSDMDIRPVVAESPGGVYSKSRIESIYRVCGIEGVASKYGDVLNFDMTWKKMSFSEASVCHEFDIITPLYDADVIIDLCKLKSHSLTKMSGAVKNFFGSVPGITKFEMHATYPENDRFCSMICDLCRMMCEKKKIIAITDAIVGMEGNGPTGGNPKKIGCIISSDDPFASDLVAQSILGFAGSVPMINEAVSRGYIPGDFHELNLVGEKPEDLFLNDFSEPDSTKKRGISALKFFSQGKMGELFSPRPLVNKELCRGCGECHNSCPQHTIIMEEKKGKRFARIEPKKCIRCFCCQELCPFTAIDTKKNFILNIISSIK